MAREAVRRSLDKAHTRLSPAPYTKSDLWRQFAAIRGIPNNRYHVLEWWPIIKAYYEERQNDGTGSVESGTSPIHSVQGTLF